MFDNLKPVDFYWALQVKEDASLEEITEAYFRLKPYYQNLVNEGHSHYTELLNLTENGYQTLSDPEKRKAYDIELHNISKTFERKRTQKLIDDLTAIRDQSAHLNLNENISDQNNSASNAGSMPVTLSLPWQIIILLFSGLVVFWLNYNASPPGIVLGVGAAIAIFFLLYFSTAIKHKSKTDIIKAIVLGVTLLTINFATYNLFQYQELYIDNQNPYDIYVKVDNEIFYDVKGYKYEITEIRPGKHEIKTFKKNGDSLLEKFEVEIIHRERRLYNVLSTAEYITGKKAYSERAALNWLNGKKGQHFEEYEMKERWIKLTYTYIFENPPSTITIKKKVTDFSAAEAVRSYLVRKNKSSF